MTRPRRMSRPTKEELARRLLKVLIDAHVEFFVVGGVAAQALGLRKKINDLDIVYRRSRENFRKIVDALTPLNPYPRGLEPGVDVPWNVSVLRDGYSFVTVTTLGDLDLIAELSGGGTFRALHQQTTRRIALGWECDVLNLIPLADHLIESGRPKDVRLAERLRAMHRRMR
ncbi:MAG: hypothetical protein O3B13_16330 [Planctomycetota bacterium]|nr:hypothetical protein [Planctomycetota bacterium]